MREQKLITLKRKMKTLAPGDACLSKFYLHLIGMNVKFFNKNILKIRLFKTIMLLNAHALLFLTS